MGVGDRDSELDLHLFLGARSSQFLCVFLLSWTNRRRGEVPFDVEALSHPLLILLLFFLLPRLEVGDFKSWCLIIIFESSGKLSVSRVYRLQTLENSETF